MKNKFTAVLVLCSLFSGIFFSQAQDSKEILELKSKLALVKNDKEKANIYDQLFLQFSKESKLDSCLVYANKSLEKFTKIKDKEGIGKANLYIGNYYFLKKAFLDAKKHLEISEKLLYTSTNYELRAKLNLILGLTLINLNEENDRALNLFNENISYINKKGIKDKNVFLITYQSMFSGNFYSNDFISSYKSLNKYVEFAEKNFPDKLFEVYYNAGAFYLRTRNFEKSVEFFKKGLAVATKNKNAELIAMFNMLIGTAYSDNKELLEGKPFLIEAKKYYEANKQYQKLASVYYQISEVNANEKDFRTGIENLEKGLKFITEKDEMYQYYISQLARLNIKSIINENRDLKTDASLIEDIKKQIQIETKSLEVFKNSKKYVVPEYYTLTHESLYEAYNAIGDYEKALQYLQKKIENNEEIYGEKKMKSLSDLQSQTELANERARIKLEEETKRVQLQKEIELKALRFEFEKKQAAAKTDEERKRLLLEEDLRRKEIQFKFDQEQQAVLLKYNQEKNIARINQEKKDVIAKADLESSKTQKNMWAIGAGLSLLLFGFAGFSYNQKRKDNKKIAEEKQKSDDLLLNILPFEVAEELKEKGKTSAKHFDEVSVLFTDFVNFTANSERIGVQEVLNELNICFTEFDSIMEKYNLEKIKTIGDAYLAVSGLPIPNDRHAKNAVNASLEILSYIQQRKKDNPNALDIRIGIHSGPIIAGIVGVKKFAYDIWGDTVNTAARMEQNSALGKLNVSEATYNLIKNDFTFEYRGKIETKGKGALEMYFVNS